MAALVVTNSIAQAVQCGRQKSDRLSWLQLLIYSPWRSLVNYEVLTLLTAIAFTL